VNDITYAILSELTRFHGSRWTPRRSWVLFLLRFSMAYQVDFFPVGDGSKSGDAIAMRFGDFSDHLKTQVVVIDGGFQSSGDALVKHIREEYGTTYVDLVVSTHPDNDHSSGLAPVIEELTVGQLWMHKPWEHTYDIAKMFQDGRVTDMSVAEGIRKSLEDV